MPVKGKVFLKVPNENFECEKYKNINKIVTRGAPTNNLSWQKKETVTLKKISRDDAIQKRKKKNEKK